MSSTAPAVNPLSDWPSRGYTGPQPWDHDALGIPPSSRGVRTGNSTFGLAPGQRNTITPTVSHHYPYLTSGSADECVHELGRKLADLGYVNTVSEGKNPFGLVDQTVMTAVRIFRRDYGITPDPSAFGGSQVTADAHIDPWTVEAILRAHHKLTH